MTLKQKKSLFIQALTIPIAAFSIIKIINESTKKEDVKVDAMEKLFSETKSKLEKARTEKQFDLIFKWFEFEALKINSLPLHVEFEKGGINFKNRSDWDIAKKKFFSRPIEDYKIIKKNEKQKSKRTN